ncbi:MAG: class I SAM-dependent methyltransferase [Alphaproteobacteria bacterium]|nr:class I SAM-dependent methyltransferase [Alphaproteobacteria bacterium]
MPTRATAVDADQGRRLIAQGRVADAAGGLIETLAGGGGGEPEARLLGRLLTRLSVQPGPLVEAALQRVCALEAIDLQPFARALSQIVLASPAWTRLVGAASTTGAEFPSADAQALRSGFLPMLLSRCVNRSLPLERGLLTLRRALLAIAASDAAAAALALDLALQAANNEYAWPESAAETAALEAIAGGAAAGRDWDVLRWSMYRSAAEIAEFPRTDASPALRRLAEAALPTAAERALRASMPRLEVPSDPTSLRVRAQYEENPYPRWLALNPPEPGERRTAILRRAPASSASRFAGPIDVLIAGCGTGRQAIGAWLGYGVPRTMLAIDLSAASLAYAARMAASHGCEGLEFLQADLLDIDRLDRAFDVVEAIGVLHHLRDPVLGWRRLAERLKPGGMMQIALYSERARQDVVAARAEIASLGLPADADGVRRLRGLVLEAPESARDWRTSLPRFGDFFSTSGCRDLVFHVEEHRFSPAGVARALATLGLEFRGFEIPGPVQGEFLRRNPAPGSLLDLDRWERFEADNPATFAGMMTFWCRRPG